MALSPSYVTLGAAAAAFAAALIATLWPLTTTYDLLVVSDQARIVLAPGTAERWPLVDAKLRSSDGSPQPISGFLQPADGVRIGLERIGSGDLIIEFGNPTADGNVATILSNEADDRARVLSEQDAIVIPREFFVGNGGRQLLVPFTGELRLPDVTRIGTVPGQPIVHEVNIRLLGKTLVGNRLYEAGRVSLGLGESIDFGDGDGQGFVLIDASPRMRVVYRRAASNGFVRRFGGSGYEVKASLFSRLSSDDVVQALWSSFAIIFGWTAIIRTRKEQP